MCKLNNTTTNPYWQVIVCVCGTMVTIFWGLFAALLLHNSVLGVSVVCLFSLGLMYATLRSVNQMGARLAAVTEYVDLSLLQSMKRHLLARCPWAKHEKLFDKVDTHSMHRAHTDRVSICRYQPKSILSSRAETPKQTKAGKRQKVHLTLVDYKQDAWQNC